jgi:hypothetical protein
LCYFKIIIICVGTIVCCFALYLAWFIRVDIWDDIIMSLNKEETKVIAVTLSITLSAVEQVIG